MGSWNQIVFAGCYRVHRQNGFVAQGGRDKRWLALSRTIRWSYYGAWKYLPMRYRISVPNVDCGITGRYQ